jgi:hypothetical protein
MVAVARLAAIAAAIRKQKGSVTARTKLLVEVDGEVQEFPFVTITV